MDGRADNTLLAAALIVGAMLLLSGMDAIVKALATDYSLWQICAARSFFSVAILAGLLAMSGVSQLSRVMSRWVVCRSLLFVAMWIAYYAALPSIKLSVAATGIYTAPLFMALLSSLLVGEPVGRERWIGVAGGFLGVLVILRPAADDFSLLTLLPVLAAVFYALAAIVTRTRLADENPLVLALSLHLGLVIMGLVGSAAIIAIAPVPTDRFLLGPWSPMQPRDWLIMALLGAVMVAVGVGVAKAYQSGPPALVGTFDYAYLVFATLWGALFFAETLDAITLIGILLIVGSGILVLTKSRKAVAVVPAFEEK